MTSSPRRRVALRPALLIMGVAALLTACVPPPAPPPPPDTSIPPAACDTSSVPTPSKPVAYAAVVDTPGPEAPVVVKFTATSEQDKDQKVRDLQDTGTIVALEQDKPVSALSVDPSNDPGYTAQWGLASANFPTAWASGTGLDGSGVRIAIVDTGVRGTHEDLTARVAAGEAFDSNLSGIALPANTNSDTSTGSGAGHGTHVAGIAAASDNAVGGVGGAPGATIVPVRVLNANGNGSDASVAAGIIWAADPTKGYRKRYGSDSGAWTTDMFVEAVYKGLTPDAARAQPGTPQRSATSPGRR